MVDTVRTMAALQTLLADNTTGLILPQAVRDLTVSVFAYAGPLAGSLLSPVNGTYVLDLSATEGYTINSFISQSSAGTCTLAVQIGGVSATGLSAVSVTTSLLTSTASAANVVAIGNKVTLVVSASTGMGTLDFKMTRTAA